MAGNVIFEVCLISCVNRMVMENKIEDDIREIDLAIQAVSRLLKRPIEKESYKIIDRGIPHEPKSLEKGKMAVYMFKYGDKYLKIGKVGPKSNARFESQHYNPESARSNLAKSLVKYDNIKKEGVGDWIKNNCRRVDILIDESLGGFALELVEAILHYRFRPKYEGKNSDEEKQE